MTAKSTTVEFIAKAIEVHGHKYRYDNVIYINNSTKVTITCYIHGDFRQSPNHHKQGGGCNKCSLANQSIRSRKSKEQFILECIQRHGNAYDYSKTDYNGNKNKIIVTCRACHTDFFPIAANHVSGSGCPICSYVLRGNLLRHKQSQFIEDATLIHNGEYDYSLVEYKQGGQKVTIIHKCCDTKFDQTPGNHKSGQGCPKCVHYVSAPETEWLNSLDIPQDHRQKTIVINGKRYNLDAFDPLTKTIHEFNGSFWHGEPRVFDHDAINKVNGVGFKELYQRTLNKEAALTAAGYIVVTMWECDWDQLKKKTG